MDQHINETSTPFRNDLGLNFEKIFSNKSSQNSTNNTFLQPANMTTIAHKVKGGTDHFHTLLIVSMVMILVVGSIGNSVVCYVFGFKQRKRRSVPETLFFYLAVVDLVASIVNPSLFLYWTLTDYQRWDFGIVGCKILAPLAPISVTLSALLILIIAVDRYIIIMHQFGRQYTTTKVKFIALAALVLSVCLYIPYILYLEVEEYPCMVVQSNDPGYAYPTVLVLILQDIGFISILVFTNVRIRCNLRHQRLSKFRRSLEERRHRSNTRLTRMLIAMSCVFCLLVIPRDILQLIFIISWLNPPGITHTATLVQINSMFKLLQTANSCVNVFIYSKMHRKFRRYLIRLVCGLILKKHLASTRLEGDTQEVPKWKKQLIKLHENNKTPSLTPTGTTPLAMTPNAMTPNAMTPNAMTPNALTPNDTPLICRRTSVAFNSPTVLKRAHSQEQSRLSPSQVLYNSVPIILLNHPLNEHSED